MRLTSILALSALFAAATAAAAQSSRSLEVAAQTTMLNQSKFDATTAGLGGRVSYDLTRWAAAEGEFNFFPRDVVRLTNTFQSATSSITYHRRRADALFGVKAGVRTERFGIFGKVRPGVTRLTNTGLGCEGQVCALALFALPVYRTEFALDMGGVFEMYPSSRAVVRFDVGDLLIQHRSLAPPCTSCSSHNVTSRLGVGWRF